MKRKLAGFLLVSVCAFQTQAGTSSDQKTVKEFCETTRTPIAVAAMQFKNMLANTVPPEDARNEATRVMRNSPQYRHASPELKAVMDRATYEATDANATLAHQKAMMDQGENLLSTISYTWGIKSTEPFSAWCNFNHLSN